jgi:hypothetical protein
MATQWLAGVLAALATTVTASVNVKYTGQPPTGYEVSFSHYDPNAKNVSVAGGLLPFTDQFRVSVMRHVHSLFSLC